MKFPIILNESNNLYFYKSIEDAELDMGVDESDKLKKVLIENFKDKDIYNLEDESMEFGDIVSKAIKLYGYAF